MWKGQDSMKKLILWALFDDGNCSYKKSIQKYFDGEFEVHCIGINNKPFDDSVNYKYHKIDLSLTNFGLLRELSKLPKPDIILASPPCESWSTADCGGRMFMSIDKEWWHVKNRDFYNEYNKKCHPVKHRQFLQKETSRIVGENTIGATIMIIEHYAKRNKKLIWAIENPATSKTWEYQKEHWCFRFYENKTYYSCYDKTFSPKPTIFKSNIKLNLKDKKIKGNNDHMARGSYDKRSAIPLNLIRDIVFQLKAKV